MKRPLKPKQGFLDLPKKSFGAIKTHIDQNHFLYVEARQLDLKNVDRLIKHLEQYKSWVKGAY